LKKILTFALRVCSICLVLSGLSQKQIMVSSTLPKNQRNSLSWVEKRLRIVSFVRFLGELRRLSRLRTVPGNPGIYYTLTSLILWHHIYSDITDMTFTDLQPRSQILFHKKKLTAEVYEKDFVQYLFIPLRVPKRTFPIKNLESHKCVLQWHVSGFVFLFN
jgi:hypothetical protein